MRDSFFWRVLAVSAIAAAFYIGSGMRGTSTSALPESLFVGTAFGGGVAAMAEETEYFVSASEDGQTVYLWEFNGARPPKFQAVSKADR